jgi:hypothetical protein
MLHIPAHARGIYLREGRLLEGTTATRLHQARGAATEAGAGASR